MKKKERHRVYMEDEKVNKIQNSIMNSLANIYQKAEEIEKFDKEKAEWVLKRVEEIRKDISDNNTQPVEFLSEIMLLQTEIMNYLDSDNYKQSATRSESRVEKSIQDELLSCRTQTISEEDKNALLQNQNEFLEDEKLAEHNQSECTEMQIYRPRKKHFWQKIIDKILNIFRQTKPVRQNEVG